MIIAYCEKCGLRVAESEIASGAAVKIGEFTYHCAKCAGAVPGAAAKKPSTKMIPRYTPAPTGGSALPQAGPRPGAGTRGSSGAVTLPAAARTTAPAPVAGSVSARGGVAAKTAERPQARNLVPILVGAVGGVVFLIGLVVAFSGGGKDETKGVKGPDTRGATPPVAAPVAPPKPVPDAPAPSTVGRNTEPAEPANLAERAKAADKELAAMRNERADRLLKDVQGWYRGNAQDPWTYKEKLEEVVAGNRSTPAAAEAAKILAGLKLPEGERSAESMSWHRDWTVTKSDQVSMADERWGRRYVLQTHPLERGVPAVLSRKWKVAEERPILEVAIRNHDNGNMRFVADVSGRRLVDETVTGGWRTYALDLSGLHGQEAEISLQNHNTGWDHEFAFWRAPRFVDRPPGEARIVTWADATPLTLAQDDAAWKNAVDVLALVDIAKDTVAGRWELKPGEGLCSDLGKHSRIEVPYQPPDEYDYKIVFTRRNSPISDCVVQLLSCKGRDFGYVLGGWRNTIAGFEDIAGKRCDLNASGACSKGWLTTGQRHTSVIQVRKDGLRAFLDGKLVSQWKTDYADMSVWREFKLRKTGGLGLATFEAEYCIHSAHVLEVSGQGTRGGGTAPATVAAAPAAETRPAETRAWKTLFDGRTLDCLRGQGVGAWRVDNGALAMVPEKRTAAQSALEFEDGDVRVRFEVKDATYMQFTARQGEAGGYTAAFDRSQLPGMFGKTHELVFTCRGDTVTATLNGQPAKVEATGQPRRGRLQFYSRDGTLRVLSLEFAEPGAATTVAAAAATTAPAPAAGAKAAAQDPVADAKTDYERLQSDVNALLLKNGVRQAVTRLEQARADPKLAGLRAALDEDIQCAKYVDDLFAAVAKGVAALTDKRAFVLRKSDGKETPVGQGSKNTVARVKDEQIELEMDMGGGKATLKVPLEQLSPETRFALARIGIAGSPDAEVKSAFANLVLFQAGLTDVTPKMLRLQFDAAKKAGAPSERVAHLLSRLEAREHEQAGEGAYKKLENLLKDKKWPDAKTFIENYRKEYAGTLVLAKLQADLDKTTADVDYQLNPAKPGLWTSYWSGQGNEQFKTMHFARAETKLCWNWGEGSPDPRVPNDFGVKWAGKLRVERDGKYRFKGDADDFVQVWVDGKKIVEKNEAEAVLSRGDHEFKVVFWDTGGGASVHVQWKLEGGFDWQEVPPNLLWYDPRHVEKYQKD